MSTHVPFVPKMQQLLLKRHESGNYQTYNEEENITHLPLHHQQCNDSSFELERRLLV